MHTYEDFRILYTLDVLCEDAAYTVGLILLNERAIDTTDANKKKSGLHPFIIVQSTCDSRNIFGHLAVLTFPNLNKGCFPLDVNACTCVRKWR